MPTDVLVIVPVYNESVSVLTDTVNGLAAAGYRVVVVDDGSVLPVPRRIFSTESTTLIRHPVNLGQGAALQTGMEYARRHVCEYIIHFDGDGQHAVHSIELLLELLIDGKADIVFGSRFLTAQSTQLVPIGRRWVLRAGRIFNGLTTGVWMSDAHIGLRALNRRAFTLIDLKENRMAYATELLWQLKQHRLRWTEVSVPVTYTAYSRQKGQSAWDAFKIAGDILLRMIYR